VTIVYRPLRPSDESFVISSWSRAYKTSRQAGMIATEDWAGVMHLQIRKALGRPDARALVACAADDDDFLFGWIAGDVSDELAPVVFFTYVKEAFRRAGHGRGLLRALGVDPSKPFRYTCWTPVLHSIAEKMPYAKHDWNFARYPKLTEERRPWKT
jgi:GNAT superfamily N-acetyltransferase